MPMVLEIPEELKSLAESLRALLALVAAQRPCAPRGRAVDYAAFEDQLAEACAQVECASHAAVLATLDLDAPAVVVNGVRFPRAGREPATYYSQAGAVVVPRTLYRDPAGGTVDAIRLRTGALPGGWLPKTATAMAFEVQKAPSREAARSATQHHRLPYSHTAFEHVAHQVGALQLTHHHDVEEELIAELEVPPETCALTASLDRVSVPIALPKPRPVGRPRKGAAQRPLEVIYKMAYCGTLTLCDAQGGKLHTIRYGCLPDADPTDLCDSLAADAQELLRRCPALLVQLVNDGAHDMWNLMKAAFTEVVLGQRAFELVDLGHLLEKLSPAARVLDGAQGPATVAGWKLKLLNQSTAAAQILRRLETSGAEESKETEERPVHEAITYLRNHAGRFDYAAARRQGLPIGSGAVEATCKSLFNVRLKRAGSRWKEPTAGDVVRLRALALSDRWDAALQKTLAPLRKPVRLAA